MKGKHNSHQGISNLLPKDIMDEIGLSSKANQEEYFSNYESHSTKNDSSYAIPHLTIPMRNPISSHHLAFNQINSQERLCPNRRIVSENQLKTFKQIQFNYNQPQSQPQAQPNQMMNTFNPYYNPMVMGQAQSMQMNMNVQCMPMPHYQSNINMNINNMNLNSPGMGLNNTSGIRPRTVKSEQTVFTQPKRRQINMNLNSNNNLNYNNNNIGIGMNIQISQAQNQCQVQGHSINQSQNKQTGLNDCNKKSKKNNSAQLDIDNLLNDLTITQIIEKQIFTKLIKTQKGSRHLQKVVKKSTSSEIELILNSISNDLTEIMCDYYSNYFLQKFIVCCSSRQRLFIFQNIEKDFSLIANDICGTHSLQGLIILIKTEEEELIIKKCIEHNLLLFSNHDNSTHIIQKVISAVSEPNRDYLNNFIISNIIDLCFNPNGICVVKSFINQNETESIIAAIIPIFELETLSLTQDQYGNFGVQEAITAYGEVKCNKIINKIIDHIAKLASQKFSSNVIDFLVEYLHNKNSSKLQTIITKLFMNEENFFELIKNKYGNFVLENTFEFITKIQLENIKKYWKENGRLVNWKEKNKIIKMIKEISI